MPRKPSAPRSEQRLVKCSCGSVNFIKSTPVYGLWATLLTVGDDGRISREGCGDGVRTVKEPKTVRCDGCGKRHPNPDALNSAD